MQTLLLPCVLSLPVLVPLQSGEQRYATGDPQPVVCARAEGVPGDESEKSRGILVEGRVLMPDGSAAVGAVVVSDSGGTAVTDEAGGFQLPVRLAARIARVQVTAVHGGTGSTLAASRSTNVPPSGALVDAGVLRLEAGTGCVPGWLPTFGENGGVDAVLRAAAVFDDGAGPALYVAGWLESAGGSVANGVARWDGTAWSAVGAGLFGGVHALAVHDDGGGPALYAGGSFDIPGVPGALHVAKWDGSAWSWVGGGTDGGVDCLASFDDGSGGGAALYAGGSFTVAGGAPAARIAKWDGASWSALSSGTSGPVLALAVHDDGSGAGPALYAGGGFATAGGASAIGIARWDGSAWFGVGGGMNQRVHALAVHDDGAGAGAALYAGGEFTLAGGVGAARVAKWDGFAWSPLGSGANDTVHALIVYDDGTGAGNALYAGGSFTIAGGTGASKVARWDGTSWSAVGGGISETIVRALAVYDDGSTGAPELYALGTFHITGDGFARRVAKWDGSSWALPGTGLDLAVKCMTVHDDGSGPALYVGGSFRRAGRTSVSRVARWDGSAWAPLGSGVNSAVWALASHDDGSGGGPALYAGGTFSVAGGVLAGQIAKWDGVSWSALGSGLNHYVEALCVHDDGSGPALYAGGWFTMAGGASANRIARWDGSSWSALGSGVNAHVKCILSHDDGSGAGPALYVGGQFGSAGGVAASRIARWNGSHWSALSSGTNASVYALVAHDDGTGGGLALYAGGSFSSAGGVSANRVARWDGLAWSALGSGIDVSHVLALAVYDDGAGAGPMLYAGGYFESAGGALAEGIARWDGAFWTGLASGMELPVQALAVLDDGGAFGPTLCVGGQFHLSASGDSHVARFGGCAVPVGTPFCFGDGSGTPCPCGNQGAPGRGCASSAAPGAALVGHGSSSVATDHLVLTGRHLRPLQPVLLFAGDVALNGGAGIHFGDGLRCVGGTVWRLGIQTSDALGTAVFGPGLATLGGFGAGDTRLFQAWYRDPGSSPCGHLFNLSNGYAVTFSD